MPSNERFRRPSEPDLKDYWDRLETKLRAQMVENPPRMARFRSITRVIRTMARPALHGSMAMVMVAVVILTGRTAPTSLEVSNHLVATSTAIGPIWVEVNEIVDPQPQRTMVSINRRPSRFVSLVLSESPSRIPLPEPNSPATV